MLFVLNAPATVFFVDLNCTNPTPPYAGWSTAATDIQSAIDASSDGDQILVTNGVFQTGGRLVYGSLTNRVVINKAVTLQSINGPAATVIQGNPMIGDSAVRCVYLTNNATLIGFTLANGATRDTAGDVTHEQTGGGAYCESVNVVLSNCVLSANSAEYSSGGIYQGTLNNCVLSSNSVVNNSGGAAGSSTLNGCILTGNSAYYGGGVYACTLYNSLLVCNQGGGNGGGALSSTLNNCFLQSNSVAGWGGGASASTLNNCVLVANSAGNLGGGALDSTLNNCTLVGNSATTGGGVYQGTLTSCVVCYNSAPNGANYTTSGIPGGSLNYCCTTPLPTAGVGNTTNPPSFVNLASGDYRLLSDSPCINAGNNAGAVVTNDLDGNPRLVGGVVDMGAYEFQTALPLTASIQVINTNAAAGFPLSFRAVFGRGNADAISWDFGDGTVVTNLSSVSHGWPSAGTFTVTLLASNDFTPGGVIATTTVNTLSQPVSYVNINGTNPIAPYLSWDTAATNIQNAINAAYEGSTVLVTDGVYQVGSTLTSDGATNRVAVNHLITLESVNGPAMTIIDGGHSMRCAYLVDGTELRGFTLTNGFSVGGGGVWCASATNVAVSNCVITANTGGGVYQGALNNCCISNNSGGGASSSTLTNCALASNLASSGGGASRCLLVNCSLIGNAAIGPFGNGGGAFASTLINCIVSGNSVDGSGGGTALGTLVNCTITGNTAKVRGKSGGSYICNETNCIIYYNTSGGGFVDNYEQGSASMVDCCTIPASPSVYATGTITNEPLLASASHLSLNSPCRGAGKAGSAMGLDIDGELWANPPSIGCDEIYPGNVIGNLSVSVGAAYTNIPAGYTNYFQANISGPVYSSKWDFGDGTAITNQPFIAHAWSTVGDYPVILTACNDTYPAGQSATNLIHVVIPTVLYVAISNQASVAPYDSWAKAATNIQHAVDMAYPGTLILVSNGVYKISSRTNLDGIMSRVMVTNSVVVQSVNGAAATTIDGGNTMRCVYLTNGAALVGFTLINGNTLNGAGVRCASTNELVSNCVLSNNAGYGAYSGTLNNCIVTHTSGNGVKSSTLNNCTITNSTGIGAVSCILNNCLVVSNSNNGISSSVANNCKIIGNKGTEFSGGAYQSTLFNCTIIGQYHTYGAYACNLRNCIIYYNDGSFGGTSTITNCCTPSLTSGFGILFSGAGNFTNAPLFINWTGGDYHLQSNSPCINAGNNAYLSGTNDLDGNPRVVGGTVDVGAYEFQTPGSILSYVWAQEYALATDGTADYADSDGTGMNNWQKWIAGLNPTNAASVLKMLSTSNGLSGITVTWQSVNTRTYYIQSSTNLAASPAFTSIQSNLVGQLGTTSYTDTTATNGGPCFYRVGVQ